MVLLDHWQIRSLTAHRCHIFASVRICGAVRHCTLNADVASRSQVILPMRCQQSTRTQGLDRVADIRKLSFHDGHDVGIGRHELNAANLLRLDVIVVVGRKDAQHRLATGRPSICSGHPVRDLPLPNGLLVEVRLKELCGEDHLRGTIGIFSELEAVYLREAIQRVPEGHVAHRELTGPSLYEHTAQVLRNRSCHVQLLASGGGELAREPIHKAPIGCS
mmetsp:Transcript_30056/g.65647  ORF Transcript_30056/g.65647 Transcript_30056/m.65647 type:complete len:219 (+) Transcript_30056:764-1420(+)